MLFIYKIADPNGQVKQGNIEANDLADARAKLSSQAGNLVAIMPAKKGVNKNKKKSGSQFVFGRVRLIDKMMFAKHLTVMIKSGMPLDESLDTLAEQASPVFAKKIVAILEEVKKGSSLANALRKFPRVFDNMFINMVAAGEAGGNLAKNLQIVATQQQKNYTMRSKVKAAAMYPAVIFIAIIVLVMVISVFVLPKLLGFFESLHATLPLSTKILIFSGNFFAENWSKVLLAIIVFVILIKVMGKFAKTRFWLHYLVLKLPIAGRISKNINWATFCRSLASLLDSGVTIDQALQIVAQTQNNDIYKRQVILIYQQVLKGTALSEVLTQDKHFPVLIARMSKVGERSGNLSETLDYLADFYEVEVDTYTKNLSTMLEPFLLVVIGLVVGFVAMSIINPIYELTSKVGV